MHSLFLPRVAVHRTLWGIVLAGGLLAADAPEHLSTGRTFAADLPKPALPTTEEVQRLKADLSKLAADEMEGRGVGTQGLNAAADYVRAEFEAAGLDTHAVNGGAYQTFTIPTGSKLGEKNSLTLTGPDGKARTLEMKKDFEVGAYGSTGSFNAPVVFCGYGLSDKDSKYDDFENVDVAGKVVVFFRRTPQQGKKDSPINARGRLGDLRSKMVEARDHHAVAVLLVNDPFTVQETNSRKNEVAEKERAKVVAAAESLADSTEPKHEELKSAVRSFWKAREELGVPADQLVPFGYAAAIDGTTLPAFQIHLEQLNAMLRQAGLPSAETLAEQIDSDLKPRSVTIPGWTVSGDTTIERTSATVQNVIGVLEGDGPLADETVVVGAHYDHVGRGGSGSLAPGSTDVHNGADDNASGTVSLIEIARFYGKSGVKPPRRMVFIAFTGEEMGLLGSAHYVKEPVFPLDKTIAMFNMDMVGRLTDGKLTVYGVKTAPQFEERINAANEGLHLRIIPQPEGFGPSDHASFYGKKIPVLHFFTGLHPDYHRPSDDFDKVNYDGMATIITFMERIITATLNDAARPSYVEVKGMANVGRTGSRPYVGTIPDFGVSEPGYAVSGVTAGSPASTAGIEGGDRIIRVGTHKVTNLDDFDLALRKFKPTDVVEFEVVRKGQPVKMNVTLAQPR